MNADEIFVTALDHADPGERNAFLDHACADNEALRREVDSLLAAHERIGAFLQKRPTLLARAGAAQVPPSGGAAPGPAEAGTTPPPAENAGLPRDSEATAGDRIGRYKLLEQIGEGGFGVVWLAEQEEPVRRLVALKVIKLGMDTRQVVARFEAERQALALMDHPNIAKVFDGGAIPQSRDRPYFVMELVKGIPITTYCDEAKFTTRQRLELVAQVCRAVQHAHQKGIIHRDLKPSNVLVTVEDGHPVPKVIDFGIAKATDARLTEKTLFTGFAQLIGTPAYMSPEQAGLGPAGAGDIDTRSDVYSLGVLLYELLTGHTPFDTRDLLKEGYEALLRTIREVDPKKPSTRLTQEVAAAGVSGHASKSALRTPRSAIDPDLDWIVMKCLEKDRARRYETANSLALDLERYLHDEPVLARPPSALYRWRKFTRKHRTGVMVAAGLLGLLATATVVSSGLALWASRERENARESEANAKAVLRFFEEKVLAAARPQGQEGGLGHEATIRAAVDAAEPAVEKAFTAQPLVEASIRETLGLTYMYLGEQQQALRQHERSLGLRKDKLGVEHPDTLTSLNNVAAALRDDGNLTNALVLFEETLKVRTSKDGPEHPTTLIAAHNLARTYLQAGQLSNALPLLERTLELQKLKLGPDHADTLISMSDLASAYRDAGRLKDALALAQGTLEIRRTKLGPDHPETLTAMNNLAVTYLTAGRPREAVPLLEETVSLRKVKLTPDHPHTLASMNNLASAYRSVGRLDDALSLGQETFERRKAKLGPDHPETLTTMNNLAVAYLRAGRPAEAVPLLETTVDLRKTVLAPDHPDTLSSMNNLAEGYRKLGRRSDALRLFEQAYEGLQRRAAQQPSPASVQALRQAAERIAQLYEAWANPDEAAKWREKLNSPAKPPANIPP